MSLEGLHILLAEDDPELRAYIHRCVTARATGIRVSEARNGLEAASILESSGVDMVISDIHLGGLDGLGLCRRIDEGAETRVPVLLISGEAELAALALDYIGDRRDRAFLRKPFNASSLLNAVRALRNKNQD